MEKYLLKNKEDFKFADYQYDSEIEYSYTDEPEHYPCLLIVFGKDGHDINTNLGTFVYEKDLRTSDNSFYNCEVFNCNILGYFIKEELLEGTFEKYLITEIDKNDMLTGITINEFGHTQTCYTHKSDSSIKEIVILKKD